MIKKSLLRYFILCLIFLLSIIFVLIFKPYEGISFSTKFLSDKIKFCITGDTGMQSEIQRDMAKTLGDQKCDRIVILGDLIYPDGVSSPDDPQIKEKFDDFYFPLTLIDNKPKVALINGNHDYSGDIDAWLKALKSRDWVLMPSRYYMEEIHGFCFYYLDSNIFLKGRHRLDALSQIRWLQEVREKNIQTCHTEIVFTHHPYLSSGHHKNATGYFKWLYEWLFIDRSQFLISGHAHLSKDLGMIGKTRILMSGAGGDIEETGRGGLLVIEMGQQEKSISYHFK